MASLKSPANILNLARKVSPSLQITRCISGRILREHGNLPKPFPYETTTFNYFRYAIGFDVTLKRFDENSRVVLVDGAHAIGKSDFAQKLADELEMRYFPRPLIEDFYISPYKDFDLRDFKHLLSDFNYPMDDKDFFRDPMGHPEGAIDRYIVNHYTLYYRQYIHALAHVFNTGQGVVVEKAPFLHPYEAKAAYNAGWIHHTTMKYLNDVYHNTFKVILKPNLIIYLDAPLSTVLKNIEKRGNEWDKDSKLWNNKAYLNNFYNLKKDRFLRKEREFSQVLVYDWSEPEEVEIVVQDIENLNFDYYSRQEKQQRDWRINSEEFATTFRITYSNPSHTADLMTMVQDFPNLDAKYLHPLTKDLYNMQEVVSVLPGAQYTTGFNPEMGDNVLFKDKANFMEHHYGFNLGNNLVNLKMNLKELVNKAQAAEAKAEA